MLIVSDFRSGFVSHVQLRDRCRHRFRFGLLHCNHQRDRANDQPSGEERARRQRFACEKGAEEHGDALTFTFTGTVTGDEIAGTLDMGEYLQASWSGTRHARLRS